MIKKQIRALLEETSALGRPVDPLSDTDDLFAAGLTSFASVSLMMAIEQEFSVSFPDSLLTRSTFANINTLSAIVTSLRDAGRVAANQ
jgi:acyl carrier protein